jgi:hypothetical protein
MGWGDDTMPSPLPGMDPYLEQPAFWASFHSRFIVALADAIEHDLAPDYYIEVEARTYLDDAAGVLIGIPDAVVVSQTQTVAEPTPLPSAMAVGAAALEGLDRPPGSTALQVRPQQVEVPMPEAVTERYLEIRELATGQVITAIELLSPKISALVRGGRPTRQNAPRFWAVIPIWWNWICCGLGNRCL